MDSSVGTASDSESRRNQGEARELDSHEEVTHFCGSRRDQEEGGELDSHEEVTHFCGSRRDQEEGGEMDSHEEVRLSFAGPGEIKRRNVVLDPQESPEDTKSMEVELGSESWTCLLLQLFLNSTATDIVLVSLLRTAIEGQRGDTALILLLFWRRSTASSVFRGRNARSSLHSFSHFSRWWWWCRASRPRMSVDILGTNCDQCRSTVQCCFTSTEPVRLIRTKSPGRPPRLSHSSWALTPQPLLLSWCLTSTEARWPIRDGDRVGRGRESERLDRGNRLKKTGGTVHRRQNNGSVKAVSPRHCPATCALRNCSFNCCAGQSH